MTNHKGAALISLGLLLIAAAICLTAYNLYEAHCAAQSAYQVIVQLDEVLPREEPDEVVANVPAEETAEEPVEVEIPDHILNPNMEMPTVNIGGLDYIGVLEIPSCDLEFPIAAQWSYPNLKLAPCRYEGSAYLNNLIIAGHNYKSHFGKLTNVMEGDIIYFTDMDGNRFAYQVAARETLQPTAIEEMKSGEWDLTLFTCTLGGSYRFTVRCEHMEE